MLIGICTTACPARDGSMRIRFTRRQIIGTALALPLGMAVADGVGAQGVQRGPKPVAIFIPAAEVDAPIETTIISDGRMQNPTGPFVVGWYRESGRLAEAGNIVMAGHLDYWGVPRAVFFHLGALDEGDEISLLGDDGNLYDYEIEWVRKIETGSEGHQAILDVITVTEEERLTLITCGGDFNRDTLEYESRTVARARPKTP
jgi:LPXTG-site transpeptidase (sortase) family protein